MLPAIWPGETIPFHPLILRKRGSSDTGVSLEIEVGTAADPEVASNRLASRHLVSLLPVLRWEAASAHCSAHSSAGWVWLAFAELKPAPRKRTVSEKELLKGTMFHVSRWKPKKVRPGQGQSRGMSSKGVGHGQGRASSLDRLSSTHPLTHEQGPAEMGFFFLEPLPNWKSPSPSIPATPRAENDSIRNSSRRVSAEGRKKRKEELAPANPPTASQRTVLNSPQFQFLPKVPAAASTCLLRDLSGMPSRRGHLEMAMAMYSLSLWPCALCLLPPHRICDNSFGHNTGNAPKIAARYLALATQISTDAHI